MNTTLSDIDLYPMRVVARVTGLAPDTVRAWERRYGAVEPHRTDGNARRYSAADIRKLSLLRDLTDAGHAIGSIAGLSAEKLEALRVQLEARTRETGPANSLEKARSEYLAAIERLDSTRASEILLRAAALLDDRTLVFSLVVPLLQQVGQRWSHGELGVAHEHLVSAEVRALLATRARMRPPAAGARRFVFSTPPGHTHEFGILAAAILAGGRGADVVYLGPDLPLHDLRFSVETGRADVLVLGVARRPAAEERESLEHVLDVLARDVDVWIGCPPDLGLANVDRRVRIFHSLEDYDIALGAALG